ncbi:MAG: hypothetical protein ACI9J3_002029 [Parvicellaceae bacterium]|jgi:hypothetical protein
MKKIFAILIFMISLTSFGQRDFHDFETWHRFKANTKYNDFKFYVAPGIRLYENSTQLKAVFSDFAVSYKVHKYFKPKFNYRYALKSKYDIGSISVHRFNLDLGSDISLGKFNLDFRDRLQVDFDYKGGELSNRTKFKVTYDMGEGIQFYGATEAWFSLGDVIPFSKYRFSFGFDLELMKRNAITVFYMRQASVTSRVPFKGNVIGVVYSMKVKSLFK